MIAFDCRKRGDPSRQRAPPDLIECLTSGVCAAHVAPTPLCYDTRHATRAFCTEHHHQILTMDKNRSKGIDWLGSGRATRVLITEPGSEQGNAYERHDADSIVGLRAWINSDDLDLLM